MVNSWLIWKDQRSYNELNVTIIFFLESINAFDIKKEEKKPHKVKQCLPAKTEKMYMMNVGFPVVNKL